MTEEEQQQAAEAQPIDARLEIKMNGGDVTVEINVVGDETLPSVLTAIWIGKNWQQVVQMAQRRHAEIEDVKKEQRSSRIAEVTPRLVSSDGKLLN